MRSGLTGLEAGSLAKGHSCVGYRDSLRSTKNGAEDLRAITVIPGQLSYWRWLTRDGAASAVLLSLRGVIETTVYSRSLLSRSSTRSSILSF